MSFHLIRLFLIFCIVFPCAFSFAQEPTISGRVISSTGPIENATITVLGQQKGTISDENGLYQIPMLALGTYTFRISAFGYESKEKILEIKESYSFELNFQLEENPSALSLDEIVVTGTMKEIRRSESPVPVEIYTPAFFKKNPTATIFDALQNVNGVRPQLNCNICATGDIHINGLEGPYTMVLIDGMPIVSGLSTVYGLSGIPNSLVDRIEIVKGPASSLYGSEAVAGLINIITKNPINAPLVSVDVFGTSYGEYNADIGGKFRVGKKATVLNGINYFKFQNRIDKNNDNITDLTLQDRISVFQKWNFTRKNNRVFSLAGRLLYEDRWGGEMDWSREFRGGDSIYGESIYTKRWEIIGNYQLPLREKVFLSFSLNGHNQNSRYGTTVYDAQQNIAFSQLVWDKKLGRHDFLIGGAMRYTFYDDSTPATSSSDTISPSNAPQQVYLPGVFLQDEITLSRKHKLLVGFRYDYNSNHGNIFTPRVAYKWTLNKQNTFRLNAGTGFRVVNLFTEDHAALTGARQVDIQNELNPEKSYNLNLNYVRKIFSKNGLFLNLDGSAFYTYFNNRIVPDYDTDPNKILYDNLNGFAESKGVSLNIDLTLKNGLKVIAGATLMENTLTENEETVQQILTENFTGTWAVSYTLQKLKLSIDYTGNLYSPMRLPLLGPLDPRQENSPWWSIQNIQLTFNGFKNFQLYGGVKNLLNWTPNRGNPFLIAGANDPFDKNVQFNQDGQAIPTANNPYGLTFDPTYIFGPNQGIRLFLGVRYNFK